MPAMANLRGIYGAWNRLDWLSFLGPLSRHCPQSILTSDLPRSGLLISHLGKLSQQTVAIGDEKHLGRLKLTEQQSCISGHGPVPVARQVGEKIALPIDAGSARSNVSLGLLKPMYDARSVHAQAYHPTPMLKTSAVELP